MLTFMIHVYCDLFRPRMLCVGCVMSFISYFPFPKGTEACHEVWVAISMHCLQQFPTPLGCPSPPPSDLARPLRYNGNKLHNYKVFSSFLFGPFSSPVRLAGSIYFVLQVRKVKQREEINIGNITSYLFYG